MPAKLVFDICEVNGVNMNNKYVLAASTALFFSVSEGTELPKNGEQDTPKSEQVTEVIGENESRKIPVVSERTKSLNPKQPNISLMRRSVTGDQIFLTPNGQKVLKPDGTSAELHMSFVKATQSTPDKLVVECGENTYEINMGEANLFARDVMQAYRESQLNNLVFLTCLTQLPKDKTERYKTELANSICDNGLLDISMKYNLLKLGNLSWTAGHSTNRFTILCNILGIQLYKAQCPQIDLSEIAQLLALPTFNEIYSNTFRLTQFGEQFKQQVFLLRSPKEAQPSSSADSTEEKE